MGETNASLIAARLLLLNTLKQHLNNRRGHNYINKEAGMKLGKLIETLQAVEAEHGAGCIVQVQGENLKLGYVFGGEANTVQVVKDTGYLAEPTTVEITAIPEKTLVVYPEIKDFMAFLA